MLIIYIFLLINKIYNISGLKSTDYSPQIQVNNMKELNSKFFGSISDIESLIHYSEELIRIPDYFNYDLSKEQLQSYVKAARANFVDSLIFLP